jgi:hypothetical protein
VQCSALRRFCFCKNDEKLVAACDKLAAWQQQQVAGQRAVGALG